MPSDREPNHAQHDRHPRPDADRARARDDRPDVVVRHRSGTGHRLFCHADFTDALLAASNEAIRRRATLVLRHLAAHGRTGITKSTRGVRNRGWRRTPLGGRGGSQFYAWWTPHHASPAEDLEAPEGAILVRALRHHDDHAPLDAGTLDQYYALDAADLERPVDHPAPWTAEQEAFARSERPTRILIGQPGTGKTEALMRAVDLHGGEQVLYLTWSRHLADLAGEHFATFAPADTRVETWTMADLLAAIVDPPVAGSFESRRAQFLADAARLAPGTLGPWSDDLDALFAEIRAHLVGPALPSAPRHLQSSDRTRLRAAEYRRRRAAILGTAALRALLDVVEGLGSAPVELYFPDLLHAATAARVLLRDRRRPAGLIRPDRIVLDEVQDLTPVEVLVPLLLASMEDDDPAAAPARFLCAGDEGQTVRPTDFEWGWFKDMIADQIGRPESVALAANLRSTRRIGELVRRVSSLYGQVPKSARPRGAGEVEVGDVINDTIIHCQAGDDAAGALEALRALAGAPGSALIRLARAVAAELPAELEGALLGPAEAKGREFQRVCVLDPGRWLNEIADARTRGDSPLALLRIRSAIDRFRVAISRATETLIFCDLDSVSAAATRDLLRDVDALPMTPADLLVHVAGPPRDADEFVREGIDDALALVDTQPARAWTRAEQAVRRLGDPDRAEAVVDQALRDEAHLARARVALALVPVADQVELAAGELMIEAKSSAKLAGCSDSAAVLKSLARWQRSRGARRSEALLELAGEIDAARPLQTWLANALQRWRGKWERDLERGAARPESACTVSAALPEAFDALGLHQEERDQQVEDLRRKALEVLLEKGRFEQAHQVLELLDAPPASLAARVLKGLGDFAGAAALFRQAGDRAAALAALRCIPDLDAALETARPGAEHRLLSWLRELRELASRRPEDLGERLTDAERSWLEEMIRELRP